MAGLGWLVFVVFMQARQHMATENADPTKTIVYFLVVVLLALIGGGFVAFSFIPAVGDWIGGLFFAPNEEVEKSPHADAIAKVAQGDFEGAIAEYHEAFKKDPSDTHAVLEMARLYCDRLGDPQAGAGVLESALEHEWTPDESASMCNHLADIYLNHMHDAPRARALLVQVAESMPNTKHSANAIHRMHEIDRTLGEGV